MRNGPIDAGDALLRGHWTESFEGISFPFQPRHAYSVLKELKAQHRAGKSRIICADEISPEVQDWLAEALLASSQIRTDAPWLQITRNEHSL